MILNDLFEFAHLLFKFLNDAFLFDLFLLTSRDLVRIVYEVHLQCGMLLDTQIFLGSRRELDR